MFSIYTKVHLTHAIMLLTGIILAPIAIATPAVQDLIDLRTVINAAANTIGDQKNPNRGWGFPFGGGSGLGTADLVNNVTSTVLGMKFQIDTNLTVECKTAWALPKNITGVSLNGTAPTPGTPTLPLSKSIAMPSTIPTTTMNATVDLSTPYIDYISSIPNLSTSLTSLGRYSTNHREMNQPVREAINGLQQSISILQSAMLQDNLIGSQAVLRTIRVSSSLENSQAAWNRFLNLPGKVASSDSSTADPGAKSPEGDAGTRKREVAGVGGRAERKAPASGKHYTHAELWGRDELYPETAKKVKSRWYDAMRLRLEDSRAQVTDGGAENGRIGRPFVV
ncbi:hypothetical protein GQ44DRAFT_618310 [Phaeosphaeriaceae sp. PMI808]|nr:hypothetical protein GQ44DRAFT_618310 [Phaeosphaeriaceae sp. PMI808]